jgi:erythromycin esterase-like protein
MFRRVLPTLLARRTAGTVSDVLGAAAHPLTGADTDYDALLALIGDTRLVLLGEASHGSYEFYAARAAITRRLIAERGFTAVAVEADWPDAERVNRYVRGLSDDPTPEAALGDFSHFPTWMWRNTVVRDFVGWLRAHNDGRAPGSPRAGFYGMDLYSLRRSIGAVLDYLDRVDVEAAAEARTRYACFGQFNADPQRYGSAAHAGLATCEEAVVEQLVALQRQVAELTRQDGRLAEDAHFSAEQNARLVKDAEAYYRAMYRGRVESWNLRDRHMAETLEALLAHLDRQGGRAKLVVWAHNSHLGDARATEHAQRGQHNVGQLVRERYGAAAVLVGFSTYAGTVTAATAWGRPAERKRVRPGLPGSYEALFHAIAERGEPAEQLIDTARRDLTPMWDFMLLLRDGGPAAETLRGPRLERAIGVIYRPETERASHYRQTRLADQFDALLYFDQTQALRPLERTPQWARGEPDTFPSGL